MPMTRTTTALLLSLLLSLTACGGGTTSSGDGGEASQPAATTGPPASQPGIAGEWLFVEGTVDGQPLTAVEGHAITLTIQSGEIVGTTGCNTYSASIGGELPAVDIGPVTSTEQACEPAEVMQVEGRYVDALTRVEAAVADADGLTLTGDGVELRFDDHTTATET